MLTITMLKTIELGGRVLTKGKEFSIARKVARALIKLNLAQGDLSDDTNIDEHSNAPISNLTEVQIKKWIEDELKKINLQNNTLNKEAVHDWITEAVSKIPAPDVLDEEEIKALILQNLPAVVPSLSESEISNLISRALDERETTIKNNAKTEIKNELKIGSRNLILNSNQEVRLTPDMTQDRVQNLNQRFNIEPNLDFSEVRELALSFYCKYNGLRRKGTRLHRIGMEVRLKWKNPEREELGWATLWINVPESGLSESRSGRVTATYKIPNGKTLQEIQYVAIGIQYLESSEEVMISKPKLEIGNTATDWTPSHEDFQNKINTIEERLNKLND